MIFLATLLRERWLKSLRGMDTNHNRFPHIHFSSTHSFCPAVFAGVHVCVCVCTCNPGVLSCADVLGEECWESSHRTEASLARESPASPHCRSAMSYNPTLDNSVFPGFMQMTKTCSPISFFLPFFPSNRHRGFQKEACLRVRIWFLAWTRGKLSNA